MKHYVKLRNSLKLTYLIVRLNAVSEEKSTIYFYRTSGFVCFRRPESFFCAQNTSQSVTAVASPYPIVGAYSTLQTRCFRFQWKGKYREGKEQGK